MATVKLLPTGFGSDSKYGSANSSYPLSRIVGKDSSTTGNYAGFTLTNGTNAETIMYIEFDTSQVPSNARITSITGKVRVYGSSTTQQRTSIRQVQLCSNTTLKGDPVSFSLNSTNIVTVTNEGGWTRAELENARIRVYYTRASSYSTSNTTTYIMGADLTIDYEEAPLVYHDLTVNDNGYNVTPTGTQQYAEGESVDIIIKNASLPKVTLDGADITNQFTEDAVSTSYSGAATASTYIGISSGTSSIAGAVGKTAESPSTSTTYWYGSQSATVDSQYAQYTFDLSSIPTEATNIQVSCKVAGAAENSTYSHQAGGRYSVWGLCSNGVAKGSQIYATTTSTKVYEFTNTGSWTRTELNNLQLRHYVGYYGGRTNGITLTISYDLPSSDKVYRYSLTISADHILVVGETLGPILNIKLNGSWKKISTIYQKINNVWIEVDLSTLDLSSVTLVHKE